MTAELVISDHTQLGSIGTNTHAQIDTSIANTIHKNIAAEISTVALKLAPASTDLVLIEDSADSYNKKSVLRSTLDYKQQVVTVAKAGGQFTVIQDAINWITDEAADKRYVVSIAPGEYNENVTVPAWISLKGMGKASEVVIYANTGNVITTSGAVLGEIEISNLTLRATPTAPGCRLVYINQGQFITARTIDLEYNPTNTYGTAVQVDLGSLEFSEIQGTYAHTGTGGGNHIMVSVAAIGGVIGISGDLTMTVAADDDVYGYKSGASVTATALINATSLQITVSHASYSSNCYGIHHIGAADNIKFIAGYLVMTATGGSVTGTGTAIYLNNGSAAISSIASHLTVTGFNLNYAANIANAGDVLLSHFDLHNAAEAVIGPGVYAYANTDAAGNFQVVGEIYGGTAPSQEVTLRGTSDANLGQIRFKSPIEFDDNSAAVVAGVNAYLMLAQATSTVSAAAFFAGVIGTAQTINFTCANFFGWSVIQCSPTLNRNALQTFIGLFTLFQVNAKLKGSGTVPPVIQVGFLYGAECQNHEANTKTVPSPSIRGASIQPVLSALVAGSTMNVTDCVGYAFQPIVTTGNATATINFGNCRAFSCSQPAGGLGLPQLGTALITSYTGLYFPNMTFQAGVCYYTVLESYLNLSTTFNYNIYCAGTAPSVHVGNFQFGEYLSHFGDTDTYWRFRADRITMVAGNVTMLDLFETTQDVIEINPGNADVDFHVEGDTNRVIDVDASIDGLGVFNTTPIAQPSSTGETVGFTAGAGTGVNDDSTFTGNVGATAYRISDIVKHLKNLGLIAQ